MQKKEQKIKVDMDHEFPLNITRRSNSYPSSDAEVTGKIKQVRVHVGSQFLSADIDEEIYKAFRQNCKTAGYTMRSVIAYLIEDFNQRFEASQLQARLLQEQNETYQKYFEKDLINSEEE